MSGEVVRYSDLEEFASRRGTGKYVFTNHPPRLFCGSQVLDHSKICEVDEQVIVSAGGYAWNAEGVCLNDYGSMSLEQAAGNGGQVVAFIKELPGSDGKRIMLSE